MRVVEWVPWVETEGKEEAVGGMGGWFNEGHAWQDYLDIWPEHIHPYVLALREDIVRRKIRRGGFWHQGVGGTYENKKTYGVPVFEDGKVGSFSMRAWGDLLAAIWSDHDGKQYCYAQFAWYTPEEDDE